MPSARKSQLRLRNREAAQKCRKRKQRGIEELQNKEVAVEALHDSLMTEASQLQQEVLVLKNMVLDHGGCACSFIEDYIQGAASNLAQQGGGCDAQTEEGSMGYGGGYLGEGDDERHGEHGGGRGAVGSLSMAPMSSLAMQHAQDSGLRL